MVQNRFYWIIILLMLRYDWAKKRVEPLILSLREIGGYAPRLMAKVLLWITGYRFTLKGFKWDKTGLS